MPQLLTMENRRYHELDGSDIGRVQLYRARAQHGDEGRFVHGMTVHLHINVTFLGRTSLICGF